MDQRTPARATEAITVCRSVGRAVACAPMTDVVTSTQDGHVRTIRLNRPEKMNAISEELAWAVIHAVQEAAADDDTWIIGLTGTGRACGSQAASASVPVRIRASIQ